MSWENTIEYYRTLNKMVHNRLGNWNSSKTLLYSVNFEEFLPLQNEGKWDEITEKMISISQKLEQAGCSALILCSNTMHKIVNDLEVHLHIPIIHVVDETAKAIKRNQLDTIGLLGTRFTMEGKFYVERLRKRHNLDVILPKKSDRDYIHEAIYTEFAQGTFLQPTKDVFLRIINDLEEEGAQGIILGCTEIPLLIKSKDINLPLFDTMEIHLSAAVKFALD
ncbi:MAG: amino acid racemase [Candidatus Lokiarchaeota archaeon]|nr:amino acid racemase [Candidatus Lokiarchaeota archaeon]MBD3341291.1 amino acid racemase [Candidatus Lokiarchaeota archaeon]